MIIKINITTIIKHPALTPQIRNTSNNGERPAQRSGGVFGVFVMSFQR